MHTTRYTNRSEDFKLNFKLLLCLVFSSFKKKRPPVSDNPIENLQDLVFLLLYFLFQVSQRRVQALSLYQYERNEKKFGSGVWIIVVRLRTANVVFIISGKNSESMFFKHIPSKCEYQCRHNFVNIVNISLCIGNKTGKTIIKAYRVWYIMLLY